MTRPPNEPPPSGSAEEYDDDGNLIEAGDRVIQLVDGVPHVYTQPESED